MKPLDVLAQSEKRRVRITAVKAMELRHSAGQSLVKIETDAGICGYGEAGAPGPTARAHIREMEPSLIGADPLEIDRLFNLMVSRMHTYRAHIPTVSGVDIALWDLAGKILDRPVCELLGGKYRDAITLYYTEGPQDPSDLGCCRDWAAQVEAHPPAIWEIDGILLARVGQAVGFVGFPARKQIVVGRTGEDIHLVRERPHAANVGLRLRRQTQPRRRTMEPCGRHPSEDVAPESFHTVHVRAKPSFRACVGPVYLDVRQGADAIVDT